MSQDNAVVPNNTAVGTSPTPDPLTSMPKVEAPPVDLQTQPDPIQKTVADNAAQQGQFSAPISHGAVDEGMALEKHIAAGFDWIRQPLRAAELEGLKAKGGDFERNFEWQNLLDNNPVLAQEFRGQADSTLQKSWQQRYTVKPEAPPPTPEEFNQMLSEGGVPLGYVSLDPTLSVEGNRKLIDWKREQLHDELMMTNGPRNLGAYVANFAGEQVGQLPIAMAAGAMSLGQASKIPLKAALTKMPELGALEWGQALRSFSWSSAKHAAVDAAIQTAAMEAITAPAKIRTQAGWSPESSALNVAMSVPLGLGAGAITGGLHAGSIKTKYYKALDAASLKYITGQMANEHLMLQKLLNMDSSAVMESAKVMEQITGIPAEVHAFGNLSTDPQYLEFKEGRQQFRKTIEQMVNSPEFKGQVFDAVEPLSPKDLAKQRDLYDAEVSNNIQRGDASAGDMLRAMNQIPERVLAAREHTAYTPEQSSYQTVLSELFGTEVRYFNSDMPGEMGDSVRMVGGKSYSTSPGRVWINSNLAQGELAEVLHEEFAHSLKWRTPEMWKAIVDTIAEHLGPQRLKTEFDKAATSRVWGLMSAPERLDEVFAGVYAKVAKDKDFWVKLEQNNKQVFNKVATYWEQMKQKIDELPSSVQPSIRKALAKDIGGRLDMAKQAGTFMINTKLAPLWASAIAQGSTREDKKQNYLSRLKNFYKDASNSIKKAAEERFFGADETDVHNEDRYLGAASMRHSLAYARTLLKNNPYIARTPELAKTLMALHEATFGTVSEASHKYYMGLASKAEMLAEGELPTKQLVAVRGNGDKVLFYELNNKAVKILDEEVPDMAVGLEKTAKQEVEAHNLNNHPLDNPNDIVFETSMEDSGDGFGKILPERSLSEITSPKEFKESIEEFLGGSMATKEGGSVATSDPYNLSRAQKSFLQSLINEDSPEFKKFAELLESEDPVKAFHKAFGEEIFDKARSIIHQALEAGGAKETNLIDIQRLYQKDPMELYTVREMKKLYGKPMTLDELRKYQSFNYAPVTEEVRSMREAVAVAHKAGFLEGARRTLQEALEKNIAEVEASYSAVKDLVDMGGDPSMLEPYIKAKAQLALTAEKIVNLTDAQILNLSEYQESLAGGDALNKGLINDLGEADGIASNHINEAFNSTHDKNGVEKKGSLLDSVKGAGSFLMDKASALADKAKGAFDAATNKGEREGPYAVIESSRAKFKTETDAAKLKAQNIEVNTRARLDAVKGDPETGKLPVDDPIVKNLQPVIHRLEAEKNAILKLHEKLTASADMDELIKRPFPEFSAAIKKLEPTANNFENARLKQYQQDLRRASRSQVAFADNQEDIFLRRVNQNIMHQEAMEALRPWFKSSDHVTALLDGRYSDKTTDVAAGDSIANTRNQLLKESVSYITNIVSKHQVADLVLGTSDEAVAFQKQIATHGVGGYKASDPRAVEIAEAFKLMNDRWINRANAAGAEVGYAKDHAFEQRYNRQIWKSTPKEELYNAWRSSIDSEQTAWNECIDGSEESFKGLFESLYDQVVSGAYRDSDSLGQEMVGVNTGLDKAFHRRIVYDPEKAVDFFTQYGPNKNIYHEMVSQLMRKYESLAQLERFKTDPAGTFDTLVEQSKMSDSKKIWAKKLYTQVDGSIDNPEHQGISNFYKGFRMLTDILALPLTTVNSLAQDCAGWAHALRLAGADSSIQTGDWHKMLQVVMNSASDAEIKMRLRAEGSALENICIAHASKLDPATPGLNRLSTLHQSFFGGIGLSTETTLMHDTFTATFTQYLAKLAKGEVPLTEQGERALARYGLTLKDLQDHSYAISKFSHDKVGNFELFQPSEVLDSEVRRKVGNFLEDIRNTAIETPSDEAKVLAKLGTRAGTLEGETVRTALKYMSWPVSFVTKTLKQIAYGFGGKGFIDMLKSGQLQYGMMQGALYLGQAMAYGYLAMNVKELLKGHEPITFIPQSQRNWNDVSKVLASGPFGNFVEAAQGFLSDRQNINPGQIALGSLGSTLYKTAMPLTQGKVGQAAYQATNLIPFHQLGEVDEASKGLLIMLFGNAVREQNDARRAYYLQTFGQHDIDPVKAK